MRPFLREQANVVPFPIGPQLDAASLCVYFGSGPPACNPQSLRFGSAKIGYGWPGGLAARRSCQRVPEASKPDLGRIVARMAANRGGRPARDGDRTRSPSAGVRAARRLFLVPNRFRHRDSRMRGPRQVKPAVGWPPWARISGHVAVGGACRGWQVDADEQPRTLSRRCPCSDAGYIYVRNARRNHRETLLPCKQDTIQAVKHIGQPPETQY